MKERRVAIPLRLVVYYSMLITCCGFTDYLAFASEVCLFSGLQKARASFPKPLNNQTGKDLLKVSFTPEKCSDCTLATRSVIIIIAYYSRMDPNGFQLVSYIEAK